MTVERGEVFGPWVRTAPAETTIRALLDLVHPTSGSATSSGSTAAATASPSARGSATCPGDFAYDPRLTGRELVSFLADVRGMHGLGRAPALAERFQADLDRPSASSRAGTGRRFVVTAAFGVVASV